MEKEHADACSGVIQKILYPFSKIYGFVVKTRIFFYKKGILKCVRLPVPVISVGNITAGGTGKTPVVEYIARYLQAKGKRVAILSRGYAARIRQEDSFTDKNVCNDEYLLFKENIPDIPNILNKDRVKGGLAAIKRFQAECLVLDDGFQHLRLARDLNIVIIDALNPFGYEQVIPRGMLREPLGGIKRAGMIILSHVDQCSRDKIAIINNRLREITGNVPVVETVHKPICLESVKDTARLDINCLRGKRVFAFCAVGNPVSFRKSVENLGAELAGFRVFPDHHVYTLSELQELNAEAKSIKPDAIVITQKDRVKIGNNLRIWEFPLWTLKIEICIVSGGEIFENKINAVLN
ncbi:MAG: tetraacyldisaccharide 4'-kinase [Candidatus Brocadiales bacterium]|nr:tetraacyldisaccharide 4'-kinase [Candidatus Brocadiales bacterium]